MKVTLAALVPLAGFAMAKPYAYSFIVCNEGYKSDGCSGDTTTRSGSVTLGHPAFVATPGTQCTLFPSGTDVSHFETCNGSACTIIGSPEGANRFISTKTDRKIICNTSNTESINVYFKSQG